MIARFSLALVAPLVLLLTGCIQINRENSWSNWSEHELRYKTNVVLAGELTDFEGIEIENRFGDVRVTASEGEAGSWSWDLTVSARTDALAQEAAGQAHCRAERVGRKIKLIVTLPERMRDTRFRSDLAVRVPRATSVRTVNRFGTLVITDLANQVDANNQHGRVEIRNVSGEVRAHNSFGALSAETTGPAHLRNQHGSIEARSIKGPLNAETSFGRLTASDVSGPVELKNQHGEISAERVEGDAIVGTSFGALRLHGIRGNAAIENQHGSVAVDDVSGSVTAKTSFGSMKVQNAGPEVVCRNQHGAIHVRARSAELRKLIASTSFGSLDVELPSDLQPAIYARAHSGKVDSDFPIYTSAEAVRGGNVQVELENNHGSIHIGRR
jgi:hypothetical protein